MRRFFIGGPADGKWLEGNWKELAGVPVYAVPSGYFIVEDQHTDDVSGAVYMAQRWYMGQDAFTIMALQGMSPTEVFRRLLDHYTPSPSTQRGEQS